MEAPVLKQSLIHVAHLFHLGFSLPSGVKTERNRRHIYLFDILRCGVSLHVRADRLEPAQFVLSLCSGEI